jgi:methionyl-tRNA formyltransferase
LSIAFFGTPDFAVPSLCSLVTSGEEISIVVTQPDRVKGRGHKLSAPPVKTVSLDLGLPVLQPDTLKDSTLIDTLTSHHLEFIIVVAYGKILPQSILELPRHGCINVHASLLPKYRGAAPIAWSIIKGEKTTGVSTMLMDEGLDTGPILLQQEIEIHEEDTTPALGQKLAVLGASLLIETLQGIRSGSLTPLPQIGEPTYAPPLKKKNGTIDWQKSAEEISYFVRGMQPWPGAQCTLNNEKVMLMKATPLEGSGTPGVIVRIKKDEIVIGTDHGLLSLVMLQPAGKKTMSASAFLQGRTLREGMSVQ